MATPLTRCISRAGRCRNLKVLIKHSLGAKWIQSDTTSAHRLFFKERFHTSSIRKSQGEVAEQSLTGSQTKDTVNDLESNLQGSLTEPDFFHLKDSVSLRSLFQARVHLGHNAGLRHESMSPFIFGERLGQDIIDIEQTLPRLQEALNVCAHIVYRGGMVLFLTRNQQILPWVERLAKEVGEYSHCRAWKRGTFTNASHIFNTLPIYPELCIFITTQDTVFEQHRAVIESSKLLIPSIGIVDTNCDISHISYPIPGNDDTPDSLHLYLSLFRTAILKAKERRKADGLN